jgi:hypothetical protein
MHDWPEDACDGAREKLAHGLKEVRSMMRELKEREHRLKSRLDDLPDDDASGVSVTARWLLDSLNWDRFCEMRGIGIYCMNEGLMGPSERFDLTVYEAKEFGLLVK